LDPLGLQDVFSPPIDFPPIVIEPPNTDPPLPPIDWPPKSPPSGLPTGSCKQVVNGLKGSMHPIIDKLLECNVNIFCGDCKGFGGVSMPSNGSGHGHICIDSGQSKGKPIRDIEALIVHEGTHFLQYFEKNRCACMGKPYTGRNPVPSNVGGSDCDACEDAERPAYRNQAEYLYPSHLPDAEAFYAKVVDWGLCFSCAGPCGGDSGSCGPFPEVPFPL
jgi:hypothetical protein